MKGLNEIRSVAEQNRRIAAEAAKVYPAMISGCGVSNDPGFILRYGKSAKYV